MGGGSRVDLGGRGDKIKLGGREGIVEGWGCGGEDRFGLRTARLGSTFVCWKSLSRHIERPRHYTDFEVWSIRPPVSEIEADIGYVSPPSWIPSDKLLSYVRSARVL